VPPPTESLVYLVDDDEAVRESTLILLETEDIVARGYATPGDFLADFDAVHAGCLIFDVHMPEMSGLELLAMLRARGVTTPAIVLTGRGDAALGETARRFGASMLSKPADDNDLLGQIRAAIGSRP
jgi:two-component system response regulator FixJ